jgi:sensor c-di-GMP phosphodiesterase-like protein
VEVGLQRFWYLRRLVLGAVGLSLLLSAVLAVVLGWRSAQKSVETSARRAVLNAERLIDRTSADLQKLDILAQRACDESTTGTLKDAVYSSTSQIREIGLIQNTTLYCTNFGPVNVDLAVIKDAFIVGTFVTVGPNAVVANNSSMFVYVSLQAGRTVNGVLNPSFMAEFERASSLSGRAHLALRYFGPPANGLPKPNGEVVYEIGQADAKLAEWPAMTGSFSSDRFPLTAQVSAGKGIFWDEYWPTAAHLFALLAPLFVVSAFGLDRLLASGALNRVRYKQALKRGQFRVFYQPIVSSQTRKMVGVEALLRWQHPRRGLLRAAQFHELFNDTSMDEPIARFVLDTVVKDFKSASLAANHLWCSFNVAPALLEQHSFVSQIVLSSKELPQKVLRLEVTERTPVSPVAEIAIRELRGEGVRVGLDDFGTGYSNINQLQTLAYDFIKVDGLLIRGLQTIDGLSPVLDAVIEMADKLGTDIVAEGVETIVQAQALSARKVNSLQGYLFSQAKPFSEILAILENENALNLTSTHLV